VGVGECRKISLEACEKIVVAFTDRGFRYLTSRQSMLKSETDLSFTIKLESARENCLPEHSSDDTASGYQDSSVFPSTEEDELERSIYGSVTLYVHLGVFSKNFQTWRLSLAHPLGTHDGIAGPYLGHLVGDGR
jgi:hypothetical protein